jgi:hypothetical protein
MGSNWKVRRFDQIFVCEVNPPPSLLERLDLRAADGSD